MGLTFNFTKPGFSRLIQKVFDHSNGAQRVGVVKNSKVLLQNLIGI
jgi:hypothetical protein